MVDFEVLRLIKYITPVALQRLFQAERFRSQRTGSVASASQRKSAEFMRPCEYFLGIGLLALREKTRPWHRNLPE